MPESSALAVTPVVAGFNRNACLGLTIQYRSNISGSALMLILRTTPLMNMEVHLV